MRIVLTNDDGVLAPGLEALEAAAAPLGEVIVVAPEEQHSGCGHQLTTDVPLVVTQLEERRFSVAGTPADCSRIALFDLVPDASLVLSGINAGANLGADVFTSGTVAAAREAVLQGVPAIALSLYLERGMGLDWQRTTEWARRVLERLLEELPSAPVDGKRPPLWNVNLPWLAAGAVDHPELVFCALDPSPLPLLYRLDPAAPDRRREFVYAGEYRLRRRADGGDIATCMSGKVAITELGV